MNKKRTKAERFDMFAMYLRQHGFIGDMLAFDLTRGKFTASERELFLQALLVEFAHRSVALADKINEVLPGTAHSIVHECIQKGETAAEAWSERP